MDCDIYQGDPTAMTLLELCEACYCERKKCLDERLFFGKTLTDIQKFDFHRHILLDPSIFGRLLVVYMQISAQNYAKKGLLRRASQAGMVIKSFHSFHLIGAEGTDSLGPISGATCDGYIQNAFLNETFCTEDEDMDQTLGENFINEMDSGIVDEIPFQILDRIVDKVPNFGRKQLGFAGMVVKDELRKARQERRYFT